jgi:zinc transporter ZupT
VAGVIGAALVLTSETFLPFGMVAAAGAMLYVVVEELIPETVPETKGKHPILARVIGTQYLVAPPVVFD